MKPEIIITSDGSATLFVKELNEHYHSTNGALTESLHVFIKNGLLFNLKNPMTVFEAGFGTGLNCLLTALEASKNKTQINYIGVEKYPLDKNTADRLNYATLAGGGASELWETIHSAPWNREACISGFFNLLKLEHDLVKNNLPNLPGFDVIYFDAFSPGVQPEIWSTGIFQSLYGRCNHNAVFTTYSAKGEVRRNLASVGFKMEKIPGPPGKKEMLRGIKNQ